MKTILKKIVYRLEVLSISVAALEKHAETQGLKGQRQTTLKEIAKEDLKKVFSDLHDLVDALPGDK